MTPKHSHTSHTHPESIQESSVALRLVATAAAATTMTATATGGGSSGGVDKYLSRRATLGHSPPRSLDNDPNMQISRIHEGAVPACNTLYQPLV